MVNTSYTLKGNNIEQPVRDFIKNHHQKGHESNYTGGFLWIYEDYSWLNNNYLMVCIRVDTTKVQNGILTIEVISGGAAEGIFRKLTFGSDKRRVTRFGKELQEFCEEQKIELEVSD